VKVSVLNWNAALSQLQVLVDAEGVVACAIEPQSISQAAVSELKLNEVMHWQVPSASGVFGAAA